MFKKIHILKRPSQLLSDREGTTFPAPWGRTQSLLPLSPALLEATRPAHSSAERKGQELQPGVGAWATCAFRVRRGLWGPVAGTWGLPGLLVKAGARP